MSCARLTDNGCLIITGRVKEIINRQFGPSFRLSASATDMPLHLDRPHIFGADDFCMSCQVCTKARPPIEPSRDKIGINEMGNVQEFLTWQFSGQGVGKRLVNPVKGRDSAFADELERGILAFVGANIDRDPAPCIVLIHELRGRTP
ncbi:MAG: hypothetical protein ACTSX7_03660 [Alphaproteobacteria bacterium]